MWCNYILNGKVRKLVKFNMENLTNIISGEGEVQNS